MRKIKEKVQGTEATEPASLSEIKDRAAVLILKRGQFLEYLYDLAGPGDISRERHALDETRKFAVESGLFTQEEMDRIWSPLGQSLTYEPVDLKSPKNPGS